MAPTIPKPDDFSVLVHHLAMPTPQKHALITGSSRGIGRGIARKLAEDGVRIAIHYYQNLAAANHTLAEVRQCGSDGFVTQADIRKPDEIARVFGEVRAQFGKLDIFVANARPEASEFFYPLMDITIAQWDSAFDSQAQGFLLGARQASNLMADGGRMLAITYAQGSRTGGVLPWVAMGCAKAAMESLIRYLAVALAKRGITVNAISPGWTADSVLNSPAAGAGPDPQLPRERLDADAAPQHPGRYRQRGGAALHRARELDHRTGDLRRRRRVADEPRSSSGDPTRLT